MGKVTFQWDPRTSLKEFILTTNQVSLLKRISGKRNSRNMAIWGENLAALAALKAGSGAAGSPISADIIYIDPPYNVGGEQGYKNTWKGKSEKERGWAGDHGAFLDFMEPRLKIGKSILAETGIVFVSICDGEYCHLKILMDQIFGEENCLGTMIWLQGRGSSSKHMATAHEYVLVYAKNARLAPALSEEKPSARLIIQKAAELKKSKMKYEDATKVFNQWVKEAKSQGVISDSDMSYKLHPESFRPFQTTASCAHVDRPSRCRTKLRHPVTKEFCKIPEKGWKWGEGTLQEMYRHDAYSTGEGFVVAGRFCYGLDEKTVPRKVQYLDEKTDQLFCGVIDISHANGKADLPPGVEFTTPKPVGLIKKLLKAYPKKNAVVLDYFAGSGTTAQSVDELNAEDGGQRAWILVEEMGSTFHKVLIPRLQKTCPHMDFGIFDIQTASVKDQQIFERFQQYSLDYLSSYHTIEEASNFSKFNRFSINDRGSQGIC
jgi:DNA modification methylase